MNALGHDTRNLLPEHESRLIREWFLRQQYRERHPYTNAPSGGWAWTHLPGGVPDADDTAGALLALRNLGVIDEGARDAARAEIDWLLNLQNRDGGIPTFCRGWGKLPFDQSSADLTAHAIRAWAAWLPDLSLEQQRRVHKGMTRARCFLTARQQREGGLAGAWKPLWFGDQHSPDEINWTYGTSRVLLALPEYAAERQIQAAARWLVKTQRPDGSWGGGHAGGESSVEETALAVEALAGLLERQSGTIAEDHSREKECAVTKGVSWLMDRIADGSWLKPSPIGFYFAKLWYFERLYPLISTVGALSRAVRVLQKGCLFVSGHSRARRVRCPLLHFVVNGKQTFG